ncbi:MULTISPECIES: hypothetical protein [unclassified Frigoribacterium]|uniref:hypothetical protein n=1 Tax=unclassified Frigoribacterium TaxID=2627005 RepID=UPI0006FEE6C4|nr:MULTISPECIES: hypothetical protein [unclassified Frigoribacterium]KQO47597.1 hypothetical protein ASF07_08990 [Frigoribacterium sp. Leaf254]KQT39690.1 hypothetical protein ASG28_08995 [Frigoribacterium sp. Leaf415]
MTARVPSAASSAGGAGTSRTVHVVRGVLIALGVALIGLGGWVLTDTVNPNRYGGLLLWLAGSVVVHDAVLAPVVAVVSLVVRRTGRRVRPAVLWIVQGAVVVGAIFSLIVVPEIVAKAKGPKNDTVLPFDYGLRLAVLWLVIAAVTAGLVALYLARRRQKVRPSTDQV